ncbi:g4844 [Coccomyxa elongata]
MSIAEHSLCPLRKVPATGGETVCPVMYGQVAQALRPQSVRGTHPLRNNYIKCSRAAFHAGRLDEQGLGCPPALAEPEKLVQFVDLDLDDRKLDPVESLAGARYPGPIFLTQYPSDGGPQVIRQLSAG